MIWFTADQHFYHTNIIKYCFRPYNSVEEMNQSMINNWNKVVRNDDLVFVLGDLILSDNKNTVKSILDNLYGQIILITGDHDYFTTLLYPERFKAIHSLFRFQDHECIDITLCHYCLRVWPKSHYNAPMLFGHSHGRLRAEGKSHDVGVDNNKFTPVSLVEIMELMKWKEDNFNLVKPRKVNKNELEQLEMEFKW